MCRIRALPVARRDLLDAVRRISRGPGGPEAAGRLVDEFGPAVPSLSSMPHGRRVYVPLRPLAHDFRALPVGSRLASYWVEEEPERVVTVARLLFARSDYASELGLG